MAEGSSIPEMKDMVQVLKSCNVNWFNFGIQLGIDKWKLDEIDESYSQKQIDRKRTDMIDAWLDKVADPTWEKFIEALEQMGDCNRAIRTVKKDFLKSGSTQATSNSSAKARPLASDRYGKPTLPLLDQFEDLKILERIGPEYSRFGLQLLQDDAGNRVNEIERKYLRDSTDIKMQIARDWLNGKGMPVNWSSLVEVLLGMDKKVLAEDVVKKLQSKRVEISMEQFDV